MRPLDYIGPKPTEAVDTAGGRTPKRRIANEKAPRKCVRSGLEQGVEGLAITCEWVRGCSHVNLLPGQDIQLGNCGSDTFELRQMRVQVEALDTAQKVETVERCVDLDRRRRSVRLGSGPEPETVLDRNAKASEERACETAEPLLRRDCPVAVVEKVRKLTLQTIVVSELGHVTNIVVWADENEMVGLREERLDRCNLGIPRFLPGTD
jgi:hypothetical protein